MYVQVEANWSDIAGTVAKVEEASGMKGFHAVEITLESVKPVEGFKSLVDAKQPAIRILVPSELIAKHSVQNGDHIRARVRRADLKRTYVHREHFSVERAKR